MKKRQSARASEAEREFPESHFIPYYAHWNKETILTKNEEMLKVIKLEGFAFETADDEDVDVKKNVRNSLFKSFASGKYAIWTHVVRRRYSSFPDRDPPGSFAGYVNEAWKKKMLSHESFTNDLYITVIRKANLAGTGKLVHWFKRIEQKSDSGGHDRALKEMYKDLSEAVERIKSTLDEYGARVLTVKKNKKGTFSEPLEFLSMLANCGARQRILLPNTDASRHMATHRLFFGDRALEVQGPERKWYAGIISIKDYPAMTAAGMMDGFLKLPFELIISQSFTFVDRQTAVEKLSLQQRQMINTRDVAVTQVAEISDALDLAVSGQVAFGEHHFSVMVMADNLKQLEEYLALASTDLVAVGATPVREKLNMEPVYWSQLPSNYDYIARKAVINSMNFAGTSSFHNYPVGQAEDNHWGPAVTAFNTSSGTTYFFNFHHRDVGHTTIIGPTGAGKTVLMNFLCAQAQKFRCRLFFFDKDRGAEIFIRALEGQYTHIRGDSNCSFNPLRLPDTPQNRAFLVDWMRALVTANGEEFTSTDLEKIQDAVTGNYKLKREDRKLENIAPFFGLEEPGSIASRLKMWHSNGPYASYFDNEKDNISFRNAATFGFEMGEVLENKVTLGPVLLYLFHKIQLSLDGTPTMIVLDEAWALIDNPVFAPKIKNWLKTLRKLNALVVFATQSVEDAGKSDISDTLIQQTSTQIFLPNPKATAMYRDAFMVSEREFQLLKTTDPTSRYFLIKQGGDVVIAQLDLGHNPDIITVLSGRAETVKILDEVRQEVGDHVDKWMPVFLERVQEYEEEKRRRKKIQEKDEE